MNEKTLSVMDNVLVFIIPVADAKLIGKCNFTVAGKGAFGLVYECKHKLYECKHKLDRSHYALEDEYYSNILREIGILAALPHPGVIRYCQSWIENFVLECSEVAARRFGNEALKKSTKTLFIVMEQCARFVKLYSKLKNKLSCEVFMHYFNGILEVLADPWRGLINGDISRDKVKIKIADFCLAGKFTPANQMHLAPELSGPLAVSSTKADMYALGLILFERSHHMATSGERRGREFQELKDNPIIPGE